MTRILIRVFFAVFIAIPIFLSLTCLYERHPKYSVHFIENLKSTEIVPVDYINDNNTDILPDNPNMAGLFSLDAEDNIRILTWHKLLRQAGIPFIGCNTIKQCTSQKILIILNNIDKPSCLSEEGISLIKEYVNNGGILIGDGMFTIKRGQLKDVFGWRDYKPSKKRKGLRLLQSYVNKYLDVPEERAVTFSTINDSIWTNGIVIGVAKTIAVFDDNMPAITVNNYGKGKAILLGISAYDSYLRNLSNRDFNANKYYINHFEPMSDIFLFFIKSSYEETIPLGLTLYTAPYGYKSTVVITHDVDSEKSIKNMSNFADLEDELTVKTTYFVQTKYQRDYKDIAFFTPDTLAHIKALADRKHEIGTHTVVHSKNFGKFPMGNCNESYPEYQPINLGKNKDDGNPTLCGEVRVPKMLLACDGIRVNSFRPGELAYNSDLAIALESSGYRYSSTFSAEDVLTYFPYRLPVEDGDSLRESHIWEFPVALEDERFPPLIFRLSSALKLFRKIHENGGVTTVLIHPDLTWYKLKNFDSLFEKRFIKSLPEDCWIAPIKEVGDFWNKRDKVIFRTWIKDNSLILSVHTPVEIEGLSFKKNSVFKMFSANNNVINAGDRIVIKYLNKGYSRWVLKIL